MWEVSAISDELECITFCRVKALEGGEELSVNEQVSESVQ